MEMVMWSGQHDVVCTDIGEFRATLNLIMLSHNAKTFLLSLALFWLARPQSFAITCPKDWNPVSVALCTRTLISLALYFAFFPSYLP